MSLKEAPLNLSHLPQSTLPIKERIRKANERLAGKYDFVFTPSDIDSITAPLRDEAKIHDYYECLAKKLVHRSAKDVGWVVLGALSGGMISKDAPPPLPMPEPASLPKKGRLFRRTAKG